MNKNACNIPVLIFKELRRVPSKFMLLHKLYSCNENITRRDIAISFSCLADRKIETSKVSCSENIANRWRPFYSTASHNFAVCSDHPENTISFFIAHINANMHMYGYILKIFKLRSHVKNNYSCICACLFQYTTNL